MTAVPASRARQAYALAVLVLVYALNFIDRNLLVILPQPIKEELGASDSAMGHAETGLEADLARTAAWEKS